MTLVSIQELITQAVAGQAVSFPTDTVPALASRPDFAQQLFTLKQRSAAKPLILMAAQTEALWPYLSGTQSERTHWQSVIAQFWPGALTLVLPASAQVPLVMNPSRTKTLGVRVPNHPVARQILAQTGPLATTSTNYSGEAPLRTAAAITEAFPEVFTLNSAEDQWSTESGVPSTVIQWTGTTWKILRAGSLAPCLAAFL